MEEKCSAGDFGVWTHVRLGIRSTAMAAPIKFVRMVRNAARRAKRNNFSAP